MHDSTRIVLFRLADCLFAAVFSYVATFELFYIAYVHPNSSFFLVVWLSWVLGGGYWALLGLFITLFAFAFSVLRMARRMHSWSMFGLLPALCIGLWFLLMI